MPHAPSIFCIRDDLHGACIFGSGVTMAARGLEADEREPVACFSAIQEQPAMT